MPGPHVQLLDGLAAPGLGDFGLHNAVVVAELDEVEHVGAGQAWASLTPMSYSGNTTRSAPIFSRIFRWMSLWALQITRLTPSSFRFRVMDAGVAVQREGRD